MKMGCSRWMLRHFSHDSVSSILSGSGANEGTKVRGWVRALRKMKDTVFLDLDDGSHPKHLQAVLKRDMVPDGLGYGAAVETTGHLLTNANNQVEMACDSVKVLGPCPVEEGYPFLAKKTYSDEYLRQYLHLRCRTSRFASLLRIRHGSWSAVHEFFMKRTFVHIDTPILTSNDCEGAGEVFKVLPDKEGLLKEGGDEGYFDSKVYLTVSGQLHLEALARSLTNVYSFGPTFRAENSKSRLHLSEFYMVEAECSHITATSQLTSLVESLVKETLQTVLDRCIEDIISYNKNNEEQRRLSDDVIRSMTSNPFTVMSYKEAADLLEKHRTKLVSKFVMGSSLTKEQELFLVKHNDNIPIFIVDWPASAKPFYMKCKSDKTALAVDLLCPSVGEVCGGGVREDDHSLLKQKLEDLKLIDKLGWYLELRKFGNVPTGGFGLGFERLLQVLLATNNIKDTIPFPRWPHNCQL